MEAPALEKMVIKERRMRHNLRKMLVELQLEVILPGSQAAALHQAVGGLKAVVLLLKVDCNHRQDSNPVSGRSQPPVIWALNQEGSRTISRHQEDSHNQEDLHNRIPSLGHPEAIPMPRHQEGLSQALASIHHQDKEDLLVKGCLQDKEDLQGNNLRQGMGGHKDKASRQDKVTGRLLGADSHRQATGSLQAKILSKGGHHQEGNTNPGGHHQEGNTNPGGHHQEGNINPAQASSLLLVNSAALLPAKTLISLVLELALVRSQCRLVLAVPQAQWLEGLQNEWRESCSTSRLRTHENLT